MNNTDPELKYSKHCQDYLVDGHRFEISIVSSDLDPEWCLEVIDENGMSHCWDELFETDDKAFEAVMVAFNEEGAEGFLQPDTNIIPFPHKYSN